MATNRNFRTLVVINPASAQGTTGKLWPKARDELEHKFGEPVPYHLTSAPMEATEITRQALRDGYEMIVSFGGDGTSNEVVNGFFDESGKALNPEAVLGLLPSGTGGDFRKSLDMGTDLKKNIAQLAGRRTRRIDLGRATYIGNNGQEESRFFLNVASFGLSGAIDDYVNRHTKFFGGTVTFFYAVMKTLLTWQHKRVRLRLDDGPYEDYLISHIDVANGQYFGGGLQIAPQASLNDGRYDVVGFIDVSLARSVYYMFLAYRGALVGQPNTFYHKAKRVTAESDEEVLIDIDGEQPGRLPAQFEILPGALRIKSK